MLSTKGRPLAVCNSNAFCHFFKEGGRKVKETIPRYREICMGEGKKNCMLRITGFCAILYGVLIWTRWQVPYNGVFPISGFLIAGFYW